MTKLSTISPTAMPARRVTPTTTAVDTREVAPSTTKTATTNTTNPTARRFVGLTPLQITLREAADRELKGKATPEDMKLLQAPENLFAWYTILGVIENQANAHTKLRQSGLDEKRLRLEAEGVDPWSSREYLLAEAEVEGANRRGLFFLTHVQTKIQAVSLLMWHEGITRRGCADLVETLLAIQREVDGGDTTNASMLLDALVEDLYRDMTIAPEVREESADEENSEGAGDVNNTVEVTHSDDGVAAGNEA